MINDEDRISTLVNRPSESLNVELKTWLDPRSDEGKAKLIKAIFAIRNRNGGYIVIGFNDTTRLPDPCTFDEEVAAVFHPDIVIGLVSKYAAIPFEVSVAMRQRDEKWYPVIVIPEGARIPAIVKSDLLGDGGKKLLLKGEVYFRTLRSNGTPSSAILSAADWPDLLEICFENREADIGRFLRRHLAGIEGQAAARLLGADPKQTLRDRTFSVLAEATDHIAQAVFKRGASDDHKKMKPLLTMCVALVLDPAKPGEIPTQEFMNKIAASNPQYTGWPIWLDTRQFREADDRAYVSNQAWQSLAISLDGGWGQHYEFLRFDPKGEFYLQRVMQDDLSDKVSSGVALDATLMIYRVAETLAVGLSMAGRLGWVEGDSAGYGFRWTGLNDRKLSSWANSFRSFGSHGSGHSHSSTTDSFISVPVDTPHSALAPYVSTAVAPLFALFDGYSPSQELVETCVRKMIERKMDS